MPYQVQEFTSFINALPVNHWHQTVNTKENDAHRVIVDAEKEYFCFCSLVSGKASCP